MLAAAVHLLADTSFEHCLCSAFVMLCTGDVVALGTDSADKCDDTVCMNYCVLTGVWLQHKQRPQSLLQSVLVLTTMS
jgi:hypothetical protein